MEERYLGGLITRRPRFKSEWRNLSWLERRRPKKSHPWPPRDSRFLRLEKADNYAIVTAITGLTREQQDAILRGEVECRMSPALEAMLPKGTAYLIPVPSGDEMLAQGFSFIGSGE